jgi:hypothetical protein
MPIQNEKVRGHTFLKAMLADAYFPKHLVGKGQDLLRQLAERIEREAPEGEAVYKLTQATAEAFNELQEEFWEASSEIETAAREAIAGDVEFTLERSLGPRLSRVSRDIPSLRTTQAHSASRFGRSSLLTDCAPIAAFICGQRRGDPYERSRHASVHCSISYVATVGLRPKDRAALWTGDRRHGGTKVSQARPHSSIRSM